ncbi:PAS domain S-box protein [Puia sp. P3]|uniref:PAS domain S-box protein n=1 Tax=Puia sp. P3 TaxID=3423952 RepID=UPI003D66D90D
MTNYEAFLSFTRNLFEASVDPFFTIDRNGWITDANAALGEITGLPISRLVGTDFRNYFSEPEKADEIRSHVINEGPVRNYPLKLRHCRGGDIDVLLNASFYSDKTLGVERIFAIARDVTEQKRPKAASKRLLKTWRSR